MDVRKTVTDAGYIAIGLGVMGYQQTQIRRRELSSKIGAVPARFDTFRVVGDLVRLDLVRLELGIRSRSGVRDRLDLDRLVTAGRLGGLLGLHAADRD